VAEDVAAELAQVQGLLSAAGAVAPMAMEGPAGSELWGEWLREDGGKMVVRAGVAPKDLARFMAEAEPTLGDAPFLTDVATGLVYTRDVPVEPLRSAAVALGGYAVALAGAVADPWGYAPDGLDLMRSIKARWDPAGLFNPDAFLV